MESSSQERGNNRYIYQNLIYPIFSVGQVSNRGLIPRARVKVHFATVKNTCLLNIWAQQHNFGYYLCQFKAAETKLYLIDSRCSTVYEN